MKKIAGIIVCALLAQTASSQWAGSSSEAGSTSQVIKNPNNQREQLRLTAGYSMYSTYVWAFLAGADDPLIDIPITGVTVEKGSRWGFNFALSKALRNNPRLELGVELGLCRGTQTLKYQTYNSLTWNIEDVSNEVSCFHSGIGLTLQYSTPINENVKFYTKAVIGPGFVVLMDSESYSYLESDMPLIVYAGGLVGFEAKRLFAEVGVSSNGNIRFGVKF
jgi:hypothetical protein